MRFSLVTKTAVTLLGACWLLGAVTFLRADGSLVWKLPQQVEPPRGEHNLASYRYGPELRASSYYRDVLSQHHPVFLVDGRERPSMVEKWASGLRDPNPWLELRWSEARQLARVKIWHGGFVESQDFTAKHYRLSCLHAHGEGTSLEVRDNRLPVATHELACPGAIGMRIDWVRLSEPNGLIRVYEVEAWGR